MKKFFVVSDIHSFYTPLIKALSKCGFDINNQDHILCVLGDVFDRGFETLEVYHFLRSIPKDRLILIKGNHEILYEELLLKHYPESHDFHNGTVRTFCQIAGFNEELLDKVYWFKKAYLEGKEPWEYRDMPQKYWKQIVDVVAMSEVTSWLQSDEWVNYYETNNYIFTHSWIPCATRWIHNCKEFPPEEYGYREDWRNATQTEWDDAMWGCPWKKAKSGWNKTGKTIVCGHWHTSDFFNNLTRQKKSIYACSIFQSKRYKLIGLDACTVMSNKVNVLVLNEDEL